MSSYVTWAVAAADNSNPRMITFIVRWFAPDPDLDGVLPSVEKGRRSDDQFQQPRASMHSRTASADLCGTRFFQSPARREGEALRCCPELQRRSWWRCA